METYGRDEPPLPIIEAIKYNAEMYIAFGENALQYDWLTAEDRAAIQLAIRNLKTGLRFIDCTTRDELMDATFRLMVGAEIIGERCTCCKSEKEFWRRQGCRAGGEKEDEPQRQRKIWEAYVQKCLTKNPKISIALLTDSLLMDKEAPPGMPKSREYLLKQVGKTKKALLRRQKDDGYEL